MMEIYAGTFLISLATLAFEIILTRILSVISWYYLAFFAVSTAMLGMTAGAITVYLNPEHFEQPTVNDAMAKSAAAYALSVPAALAVLCFSPLLYIQVFSDVWRVLLSSFLCILPFYFSGIAVTAALTKQPLPPGKIYAANLAGAALGCVFVLWGADMLDAPDLMLLCAPLGALAACYYARKSGSQALKKNLLAVLVAVSALFLYNTFVNNWIKPGAIKIGRLGKSTYFVKWNSFSRVAVMDWGYGQPLYWAKSPAAPQYNIEQKYLMIDGLAGSPIIGFKSMKDIEYLKYDMVNLAYYLGRSGDACVIGAGGGRDVDSAILFGHKNVLALEVNPIIAGLQDDFLDFANLKNRAGVRFVTDDARSYLSGSTEKFSVIQMSLTDTWAATGAGAFSLSENGLYTIEAWKIFLDRLDSRGVFTVSRWFNPDNPGETARVVSLAAAALMKSGIRDPSGHIILACIKNISTLIISKDPFTAADTAAIKKTCERLKFGLLLAPGEKPANGLLGKIASSDSIGQLNKTIENEPLNYRPPTDDTPFFFNMLKLGSLGFAFKAESGMLKGNILANLTLLTLLCSLLFFSLLMIAGPLIAGALRKNVGSGLMPQAAAYFSLIGAGFMLVEIAMIQRLSLFLGRPVYALGILLFSLILSAGAGSFFSGRLPLTRKPWVYVYPAVIGSLLLALAFMMPVVMGGMAAASMGVKILVSIIIIMPAGLAMGVCFPAGMKIVENICREEAPFCCAYNGMFGVLCSAAAVCISIYSGISVNLYLAAICYFSLLLCLPGMLRSEHKLLNYKP
jgi:hypothetical protein